MTTTPPPDIKILTQVLDGLRAHVMLTDEGERGRVCHVDGYPSTMDCTCGCAHNRHIGTTLEDTRCMGYVGRPDCTCTGFVPSAADVAELWQAHVAMLKVLDVENIEPLVPYLPRRLRQRFAARVLATIVPVP